MRINDPLSFAHDCTEKGKEKSYLFNQMISFFAMRHCCPALYAKGSPVFIKIVSMDELILTASLVPLSYPWKKQEGDVPTNKEALFVTPARR